VTARNVPSALGEARAITASAQQSRVTKLKSMLAKISEVSAKNAFERRRGHVMIQIFFGTPVLTDDPHGLVLETWML
jgi:hypothetical protein